MRSCQVVDPHSHDAGGFPDDPAVFLQFPDKLPRRASVRRKPSIKVDSDEEGGGSPRSRAVALSLSLPRRGSTAWRELAAGDEVRAHMVLAHHGGNNNMKISCALLCVAGARRMTTTSSRTKPCTT